jgi:alpha-amylase
MGFRAILAGGAGRPAGIDETVLYRPAACRKASILFRHDTLSDEMARLCSGEGRSAGEFPLSLKEKFRGDELVNLFLDYETPGQGIAALLGSLPGTVLKQRAWRFETPGEAAARYRPTGEIELPEPARPSAPLQKDALNTLYALEGRLRVTGGRTFIDAWRTLQASDHFESMNTERPSDGSIRRPGQEWPSPYDAYIHYMNILKDFSGRIAGKTGVRP